MARHSDAIDGVALLNKPSGLSSNQALQQLRRHLAAAKAGHGGTLDPMATGLLLIAFGEATKFAQAWLEADKTYTFRVVFGAATDTGDATGAVVRTAETSVTETALQAVLPQFLGEIEQIPPMVSALKRDGKPLYQLAREGVTVAREPRRVTIHLMECIAFDEAAQRAVLRATVSKGTYIRALAEAIGTTLGVPAHVDQLHRDAVGPFSCDAALSLAAWCALPSEHARARLLPVDTLVRHLPAIALDSAQAERFRHGQPVTLRERTNAHRLAPQSNSGVQLRETERALSVRVYLRDGTGYRFLGVGEWQLQAGVLSPKRVVAKLLHSSPTLPEAIGNDVVWNRTFEDVKEYRYAG